MQMIGKVEAFLENYEQDLVYKRGCGIDSLNGGTCGTPEFDTDDEVAEYLADLKTTIELVRSN